jgi:hypothetical protein
VIWVKIIIKMQTRPNLKDASVKPLINQQTLNNFSMSYTQNQAKTVNDHKKIVIKGNVPNT